MRHLRPLSLIFIALIYAGVNRTAVQAQKKNMQLAFVLLSEPRLPKDEDVVKSFAAFATKDQRIQLAAERAKAATETPGLEFELKPDGKALVALLPVAVPNGEADAAVRYSLSAMGTGWKLPVHKAHLVVTCDCGGTPLESLSLFTSLLGAVAKASSAVGIYWGGAGATHAPKFFMETAQEPDIDLRLTLWTGVSVGREPDGRFSLLSLGMKQLNLPDLLLIAPQSEGNSALEPFFTFLTYVAHRGEPLPEGDTIGRSETEKLTVRYVPSPLDPKTKVWRVEIK